MQAEISLRCPEGTDVWTEMLDYRKVGTLTTDHAASSYGQPVVLVGQELIDYAHIAGVHLLACSAEAWAKVHATLSPFGIRVTRQAGM